MRHRLSAIPEAYVSIDSLRVLSATDVRPRQQPELVADRIVTFAEIVVGTDCGLGTRVHPQIAWAKPVIIPGSSRLNPLSPTMRNSSKSSPATALL